MPLRKARADVKFQSSPGQKAGCNRLGLFTLSLNISSFNPHPARRPGATIRGAAPATDQVTGFNPHPAKRPGATPLPSARWRCSSVSILTRPSGRVQQAVSFGLSTAIVTFQSSPGQKAGCNLPAVQDRRILGACFNPHPAFWPGCNTADSVRKPFSPVSILTRPEGRVQPRGRWDCERCPPVSILTRPEGRVQRLLQMAYTCPTWFQSSPRPEGRVQRLARPFLRTQGRVSILTRPEGRVQRPPAAAPQGAGMGFNPHPARRPGATGVRTPPARHRRERFNPHPARRPGATLGRWPTPASRFQCFNPHPARRPGATGTRRNSTTGSSWVSILTRPEGRVQLAVHEPQHHPLQGFNPHPARRPVCNSHSLLIRASLPCFNPHPARRPGATSTDWQRICGIVCFNPHPARRPGATTDLDTYLNTTAGFNPHPARRPGATRPIAGQSGHHRGFNPHPARRPGATCLSPSATSCASTRFNPHPARRPVATTGDDGVIAWLAEFQSSPGQKAGCNFRTLRTGRKAASFNPHPARRPGATPGGALEGTLHLPVSILTRPEGRVQPRLHSRYGRWHISVSILTRPEGRVQPPGGSSGACRPAGVSILTRPEGRVQLSSVRGITSATMFQSSPDQKAGCNPPEITNSYSQKTFQSSPGQKAGCNLYKQRWKRSCHASFNPHPARRPGATPVQGWQAQQA